MTPRLWIGIVLFAVGLVIRRAWKPFLEAYAQHLGAAPPRGWLRPAV